MVRGTYRSVLLVLTLFVLVPFIEAQRPPLVTQRVLVLHSYSVDFQWTRDVDEAIRQTLRPNLDDKIVILSEFLDTKHHSSPDYFDAAARFLAAKYAGIQIDVIIVSDNLALSFLQTYRDAVFGPVPTIFTGINEYDPILTKGLVNVSGVAEALDVGETLELALSLTAGDSIWVFGDGTTTSYRNLTTVQRELHRLGTVRVIRIFPTISRTSLIKVAEEVSPDDIVLLIGSIVDDNGEIIPFDLAGTFVSESVSAPVFSFWDFFMGTGVLGGKLVSGREQGRAAASMTRRVLSGTDVRNIPILMDSPNRWIFDDAALRRHKLSEEDLPRGSVLLNQKPSVWQMYRRQVLIVLGVLGALLMFISFLAFDIRHRAIVARQLQDSLNEKNVLLKEIHHRVKNNLQVISSILNMQSMAVQDPTALGYFKDCETRVHSMALVHEQLYQTTTLAYISMRDYVEELLSSLYSAMTDSIDGISVVSEIDDTEMDLDRAIPVGLILNELISNAMKYAYPDRRGEIRISMSGCDEDQCHIVVRDYGVGIPEANMTGTSIDSGNTLGLQLVYALAAQLNGDVAFSNQNPGLEVRVTIQSSATTGANQTA